MPLPHVPNAADYLSRKVVPIQPWLRAKVRDGQRSLEPRIEAVQKGLIPNTMDWCRHFDTNAPLLRDDAVDGQRIFPAED